MRPNFCSVAFPLSRVKCLRRNWVPALPTEEGPCREPFLSRVLRGPRFRRRLPTAGTPARKETKGRSGTAAGDPARSPRPAAALLNLPARRTEAGALPGAGRSRWGLPAEAPPAVRLPKAALPPRPGPPFRRPALGDPKPARAEEPTRPALQKGSPGHKPAAAPKPGAIRGCGTSRSLRPGEPRSVPH